MQNCLLQSAQVSGLDPTVFQSDRFCGGGWLPRASGMMVLLVKQVHLQNDGGAIHGGVIRFVYRDHAW